MSRAARQPRNRVQRLLRGLALGSAALLAGGALPLLHAESALASAPLACDQTTVYGIDASGALRSIDVSSGTTAAVATMPNNTNALGVSTGGTHAYAFSSGTGVNRMDDYDAVANTVSQVSSVDSTAAAIRGAVDPVNGLFYYAVSTPTSSGTTTTAIGAYDPATGTRLGQVGTVRLPASGSGGDMAFSKSGALFFLTGNLIYSVDGPVPSTPGTTVLDGTLLTTIGGIASSPGIAFAANGYLYASSGSTLKQIDPASGAVTGTVTMTGGFSPNDLASCNNPDTLSASVQVPARIRPSDQWTVTLGGGSAWAPAAKSATTSGTATGVQAAGPGPVLAIGGQTYTAVQTMASGTASDYVTTWVCSDSVGPSVNNWIHNDHDCL